MAVSEKIKDLRLLLGEKASIEKKEFYPFSAFSSGIPKGCLIELTGFAKVEWIIQFLKENKDLKVLWLEEKQRVLPTTLSQRGVSLKRIVFAVVEKEIFSSLRRVIQSHSFQVVISPSSFKEIKLLRSLQMWTEKSQTTLFLLAQKHQTAWPIGVQCEVSRHTKSSDFEVQLFKNKYSHCEI